MISCMLGPAAPSRSSVYGPEGSLLAPSESVAPSSLLLGIPTTKATAARSLALPLPLRAELVGRAKSPASPPAFLALASKACSLPFLLHAWYASVSYCPATTLTPAVRAEGVIAPPGEDGVESPAACCWKRRPSRDRRERDWDRVVSVE